MVEAGDTLVKIPRAIGKSGDITGGLPRVTELFEARNPSNPAVVTEIDGEACLRKDKEREQEISITSKTGETKKYLVPLSKQILVQENDYVRAEYCTFRWCCHSIRHTFYQRTYKSSGIYC